VGKLYTVQLQICYSVYILKIVIIGRDSRVVKIIAMKKNDAVFVAHLAYNSIATHACVDVFEQRYHGRVYNGSHNRRIL